MQSHLSVSDKMNFIFSHLKGQKEMKKNKNEEGKERIMVKL